MVLLVQAYLVAYNLLSAIGWSLILYHTLAHLFGAPQPDSLLAKTNVALPFIWVPSLLLYTHACTTYNTVGWTTTYVQSSAKLDVLDVLLGLVHSPLSMILVQVSSWLFSIWCIAVCFPSMCVPSLKTRPRLLILTLARPTPGPSAACSTQAWSSPGR